MSRLAGDERRSAVEAARFVAIKCVLLTNGAGLALFEPAVLRPRGEECDRADDLDLDLLEA